MLEEYHSTVWEFRRLYDKYWATPEPKDCLYYALTEMGEAVDAYLRTKRPNDARNRNKKLSVYVELADAAIMLLSSMDYLDAKSPLFPPYYDLDEVFVKVTNAVLNFNNSLTLWTIPVIDALWMIEAAPFDLGEEIEHRLKSIYLKHAYPYDGTLKEWQINIYNGDDLVHTQVLDHLYPSDAMAETEAGKLADTLVRSDDDWTLTVRRPTFVDWRGGNHKFFKIA